MADLTQTFLGTLKKRLDEPCDNLLIVHRNKNVFYNYDNILCPVEYLAAVV